MAVVIWVDAESLPFAAGDVRAALAPDIEHRDVSTAAAQGAEGFDVAVIPAAGRSSISIAGTLHKISPAAHLIFAGESKAAAEMKSALLLAPRIGRHWTVLEGKEPAAVAEEVSIAVRGVQNRRQLRTTLDRMNVRLAREVDPARLRRLTISDRFLASLLSQAADPILALDVNGKIETANRAAMTVFGRDPRGSELTSLLDDEGGRDLSVAMKTQRDARLRARLRGDAGRTLELSITPVRSEELTIGFSVVGRDVTDAQRSQKIADFLDHASEILFSSLDWSSTFERAARAAVPFLGELCVIDVFENDQLIRKTVVSSDPELLGPGFRSVGHPIELDPRHPAAEAIATGEPVAKVIDEEFWNAVVPEAPASSRPGKATLNLPLRVRGEVKGAISFLSWDRTYDSVDVASGMEFARRAALALDNARLYEEAARANRIKDEFLATLSHELRTPMTSILGWSRMLELEALDAETAAEAAQSIRRSAEAQAQLIDDLLDVSRVVAGKFHLEIESVPIASIVEAAVETVRPAADARGVTIEADIDPDPIVRGDPARLQQVVWNLLSNAVKFTPKGGRVSVEADRSESNVRLFVRDTGAGIPPDFLPHLFERFRQVDSSTRRSMGGLGLGLAIVRHLVELHGGTITAESEGEGKGATFTVTLPLTAVFEPLSEKEPAQRPRRSTRDIAMRDLSGSTVLVVEDDTQARHLIETILRSAGADVCLASSVAEARLELARVRPDLVVSDIGMPEEDGFDLIRELRAEGSEAFPVVALTAYGRPEEREKILAAGFTSYLMKPVDPIELVATIDEVLREARSRR